VPQYAIGILLLSLMPAAIVVASLCMISGAKVALGISLTVISSILIPVVIPGIFSFLGHQVDVNEIALFFTLIMVIFFPFALYFFCATRLPKHKKWVEDNGKSLSVVLMSLVLFIIVSSYKTEFLNNIDILLEGTLIMFVLFFVFYLFGYAFSQFVAEEQRLTYIWASGAINNGLAIGLSFLYFSPETTFFVVISEVVWCAYVAATQWYFSKTKA
jgi:predicted Na+-dependent transporter